MKTHFAVHLREYSGFGRSFGRELPELTRSCSINDRTTAPITKFVEQVECARCKRTYEYKVAAAKLKEELR